MSSISLHKSHSADPPGRLQGRAAPLIKEALKLAALKLPTQANINEAARPMQLRQQKQRGKPGQHGMQDGQERKKPPRLHMPNNRGKEATQPTLLGRHEKLERHRKQPMHAASKNGPEKQRRLPGLKLPLLKRKRQVELRRPSCNVAKKWKMKRFVRPPSKQQQRGQQRRATGSKLPSLTDRRQPAMLKVGWLLSLQQLGLER